jgi:hypothetical protein
MSVRTTADRDAYRLGPSVSLTEAVFDLLDDGEGGQLDINWGGHGVDYHRLGDGGRYLRSVRAKFANTRSTVVSTDLWQAIKYWADSYPESDRYEFHAATALFPSAWQAVASRLPRFRQGRFSAEDRALLACLFPPHQDLDFLSRVWLRVRADLCEPLVDELRWRASRLEGAAHGDRDADNLVAGLIDRFAAPRRSGDHEIITCAEAARLTGLDPAAASGRTFGAEQLVSQYLHALPQHLAVHAPSPGRVGGGNSNGDASRQVIRVDSRTTVMVVGQHGAETSSALTSAATKAGLVPIALRGGLGLGRPLLAGLRHELGAVTGGYPSLDDAAEILADAAVVLLVDAFGGPVGADRELRDELPAALAANSAIRVAALCSSPERALALGYRTEAVTTAEGTETSR